VIDIRLIRDQPELVEAGARKKRIALDLGPIRALDARRTSAQQELDRLRSEQNAAAKAIGQAPAAERAKLAEGAKAGKAQLKEKEEAYARLGTELDALLLRVPNVPAAEVPEGKDDSENVEIKRWGEPRRFEFEPRDHIALGEGQDWIDVERGARIAGSRNYFLKGDLSLLEGALLRFALESMVAKGFVPLSVPNRSNIPDLHDEDVVEVPCVVSANGARPLHVGRVPDRVRPLLTKVKDYERLTIAAARAGSIASAQDALAANPLVPNRATAGRIIDDLLPLW